MTIRKGTFLAAVLTLGIYAFLPYDSHIVENYYSNFIFKYVREFYDLAHFYIPFPIIYGVFFLLFLGGFIYFRRLRKENRNKNRSQVILIFFLGDAIALISIIVIAFYWLWAFNYKRISFEERIGFEKQEITEDWIFKELQEVNLQLTTIRSELDTIIIPSNIEDECRQSLLPVLDKLSYEPKGKVRVRILKPHGTLLVWSTAGVYLPFVSEGHIDGGLHSITQPFTLSHEMSHGYGVAEESTCNFLAFMSCINSDKDYIQYSGWMGYFRYLLAAARRTNGERFNEFLDVGMNESIKADLNAIYRQHQKFPDIMPMVRDRIYNSYLKTHGIHEGTINYSHIIHLAQNWKDQKGSYLIDGLKDK